MTAFLADGSEWLTAWGSVATGVGALVAVGVTVWLARRDRQRNEASRRQDLARHESELAEERTRAAQDRADAERRLREEREFAEVLRRTERQRECVAGLLGAIGGLMPYWDAVPNLYGDPDWKPGEQPTREIAPYRQMECREVLRALKLAVDTQLVGLGDERAAEQCRMLAHLAQTAARGVPRDLRVRAGQDLRRYAIFVRTSLGNLIEAGQSLDPGAPQFPLLKRMPVHDTPWHPTSAAPGWTEAIRQEPDDPFYGPAD
ncbi:MAG TPA: hypothetical protein VGS19_14775 [Streptosporangiaceae bacterium]|nr:hypothetical protein [Streptosporangiaceae bacterium]